MYKRRAWRRISLQQNIAEHSQHNITRLTNYTSNQGDHSPDDVKFPHGEWYSCGALSMLSVTHIMPVLVLLSVVEVGMRQYIIWNHVLHIQHTMDS